MIKFQQSQALTSHFERFWSIVNQQLKRNRECIDLQHCVCMYPDVLCCIVKVDTLNYVVLLWYPLSI